MALFNRNNNSDTINQIHQKIDWMNNLLCHIENSLKENGGIDIYNELRVSSWLERIIELQNETDILLGQLSPKERDNLRLKWMDGRILPLAIWNSSYTFGMSQLLHLITTYTGKSPFK